MSQCYHTIDHRITPEQSDFLSRLECITWHQDIPTPTATVYSQHFVMKLAQGNVTVLLDGQGADELFAGYLSHAVMYLNDLRRRDPARWTREYAQFVASIYPRFFASQSWREFGTRVMRYFARGQKPLPLLMPELESMAERRQSLTPQRDLKNAERLDAAGRRSRAHQRPALREAAGRLT